MPSLFEDDFSGEGATIDLKSHTPTSIGDSWAMLICTAGGDTLKVYTSGTMRVNGGGGAGSALLVLAANVASGGGAYSSTEYDVKITITNVQSTGDDPFFLLGRLVSNASTCYAAFVWPSAVASNLALVKYVSGVQTLLSAGSAAVISGNVITLAIQDSAKRLLVSDVTIFSSTDNVISGAGRAGIGMGSFFSTTDETTVWWFLDSFVVSAYAAASAGGGDGTGHTQTNIFCGAFSSISGRDYTLARVG